MAVHVIRPGGRLELNAGHPEVMQDPSGKPLEFASVEEAVAFLMSVGFSFDDLGEFFYAHDSLSAGPGRTVKRR